MIEYRNPEPAYEEEDEDPRPRDRWGRFLNYDLEEEEPIEEEFAEASVEEEPVEEGGYQDDFEDDDDYE
jgi:hypothetical protein